MTEFLSRPWPWYVTGPLVGILVPVLLLLGNKPFGVSSSLRAICAAVAPGRVEFFRYDWKRSSGWLLAFVAGLLLGGLLAGRALGVGAPAIAPDTRAALAALGLGPQISGLAPPELFGWHALLTWRGWLFTLGGGFLVGFGSAYAGGCTSGHGVTGLAALELPSLIAIVAIFAGGLFATWVLLPALLR